MNGYPTANLSPPFSHPPDHTLPSICQECVCWSPQDNGKPLTLLGSRVHYLCVWCCYCCCFHLLPDLSFWARRGRDPWRYIQRLLSKCGMLVPSLFFLDLADLWSSLYVPLVSCTPPVCASQGSHFSEGVGRTAHHCGTHVSGKVPYTIYGISAPPMCSCKLMIAIVCCISDSLYMYVGVACTYSSFPPPPAVQANSAHYSSGLHPPHNEDHCAAAFS